jgi:hypothetical protein
MPHPTIHLAVFVPSKSLTATHQYRHGDELAILVIICTCIVDRAIATKTPRTMAYGVVFGSILGNESDIAA